MNKKETLLASLRSAQRKALIKDNPLIMERNALIKKLYRQGASIYLLSEITGLSKSTIGRIGNQDYVYGRRKTNKAYNIDLSCIRKAIKALWCKIVKVNCKGYR